MTLTADALLAVNDTEVLKVPVPEWKQDVYVRQLGLGEALDYNDRLQKAEGTKQVIATQLAAYLCDENGARIFADEAAVAPLLSRRIAILKRIISAGDTLNLVQSGAAKEKS